MNNKILSVLVLIVIVAGGAFYAGTAYGKGRSPMRGQYAGVAPGGMRGARGMGGFTAGQIVTKDATSITVKMTNGSTVIVLLATSTPVMKSAAGTLDDLTIGTDVVASGSTNSDGSITASSIQIRPADMTGFGPRGGQPQGQ